MASRVSCGACVVKSPDSEWPGRPTLIWTYLTSCGYTCRSGDIPRGINRPLPFLTERIDRVISHDTEPPPVVNSSTQPYHPNPGQPIQLILPNPVSYMILKYQLISPGFVHNSPTVEDGMAASLTNSCMICPVSQCAYCMTERIIIDHNIRILKVFLK